MEQIVSNVEKKAFLKWLLERRELRNRETVWLLNYMMGNEKLLGLIHFVDNIAGCNRAMTICERKNSAENFEYAKATVRTNDPEKAFHDLRLNQEEAVYVKVALSSAHYYPEYFSVLEENPNIEETVHKKYGRAAEDAAGAAERAYTEKKLYEAINDALDRGDAERFYQLTEQLKSLKS
ncbi:MULTISPECIES: YpiB family protein [unclassified Sporolactobacillus]|uniref:YpiB family protein n=1 Tax=unclassified Sporolactobacillus TaxID=2628533 RepID=UPI002368859D|nr:YpiB family protein [Sporolactobacillus sp. CQH2019]MDD9148670.1 YpiB family protein [Sporolactobacillus sp. CQH2019]